MGEDLTYINIHNICRCCLGSGKDIENIRNGVSMPLTQWENTHIKQCKDCNATYVSLWYTSIHCGPCAAKRTAIRKKKQQEILQKRLQAEHERAILLQKLIEEKERRKAARFEKLSSEELQAIQAKRIKTYFRGRMPFDITTICRIIAEKSPANPDINTYEMLYDFFVTCHPFWMLSKKFNRSRSGLDLMIERLCTSMLYFQRNYWMFKPIKRLSKAEKTQIIQQQINNIIESQSRTE